jgi:hypothetical protein
MPGRLYLIDRQGKVAFKSGRGPYLFKPDELEQALILLLLEETQKTPTPAARISRRDGSTGRDGQEPGESRESTRNDRRPDPARAGDK